MKLIREAAFRRNAFQRFIGNHHEILSTLYSLSNYVLIRREFKIFLELALKAGQTQLRDAGEIRESDRAL